MNCEKQILNIKNLKLRFIFRIIFMIFVILIIYLPSAYAKTVHVYPIEGPLSKISPLPVLTAKVKGTWGSSGSFVLTYPDGEECKGHWAALSPQAVGFAIGSLMSEYGSVLGSGVTFENAAGINRGEAICVSEKGVVVNVEFYTGSGTASGLGVGRDNKGNIFKLIF